MKQPTGPDLDREDPPALKAGNATWGPAQSVLQTGTHHGDTHIHPPPQRQPGRMWLAGGALLAGAGIVLVAVVVMLQAAPRSAMTTDRDLATTQTGSSDAPTTSSAVLTAPSTAPTSPSTPPTAPSTATADANCPSGTHILPRTRNSGCVVDNPAVSPANAEANWGDGGTTVMLIGVGYKTYFSTNGEPFTRLGNGFANSQDDGITFHSTGSDSGYFKIAGGDRQWYCVDFWAVAGSPADHGIWKPCRSDQ